MRLSLVAAASAMLMTSAALAQESPVSAGTPLPDYAKPHPAPTDAGPAVRAGQRLGARPNIMLTGYWPPTNEMLRRWSSNAMQNPMGWIGGNWENRGYDILAYFPEFPNGLGRGEGDFEVDYQDTSNDWWPLVDQLKPIAIITFSRANTTNGWELEGGNRTYVSSQWTADYLAPTRPTPELPIMQLEPPLTERFSSLPIASIIADVAASGAAVNPFSTVIDDGRFLSNFIGYHGCWYHTLHSDPQDPAWNIAAGHIHVGMNTQLSAAVQATEVTLRALIRHVDRVRASPGDCNCDGGIDGRDLQAFVDALLDAAVYTNAYPACVRVNADLTLDDVVDVNDVPLFANLLIGL
ncbi:MAG: hypothetical protein L6Q92_15085 [Phycisphaerae bacterium]|nr:hypothetical protein [Phycisphaerae bacterium]